MPCSKCTGTSPKCLATLLGNVYLQASANLRQGTLKLLNMADSKAATTMGTAMLNPAR